MRVRISGGRAWLNIKGMTLGSTRLEFEYEIPLADGEVMLRDLADGPVVSKIRHHAHVGAHLFEIDEFDGDNEMKRIRCFPSAVERMQERGEEA